MLFVTFHGGETGGSFCRTSIDREKRLFPNINSICSWLARSVAADLFDHGKDVRPCT
jgi:hypothetical protein